MSPSDSAPNNSAPPAPKHRAFFTLLSRLGGLCLTLTSNLGALVLLLVIGHVLIGWAWDLKQARLGDRQWDPRVEYPGYDHLANKYAFARENVQAANTHGFRPHYEWRVMPFKGQYVNVDASGVRRTIKSPRPGAKKVFMMGGSTTWGEGVPDADTMPSRLQAILGPEYDVYNFGDIAYTSVQELAYLQERLTRGDIPDIVVFYDGVNDGFASVYAPGVPREIHAIDKLLGFRPERVTLASAFRDLYEQSHYAKLPKLAKLLPQGHREPTDTPWDQKIAPKIARNVQQTLDDYEAVIRQTRALAQEYDFQVVFFWQPNLFSDRRAPQGHEPEIFTEASPTWVRAMRTLYAAARQRFSGREAEGIYYLGDVFDNVGPAYIDWCHVSPPHNARVARAIAEKLLAPAPSPEAPPVDKAASR